MNFGFVSLKLNFTQLPLVQRIWGLNGLVVKYFEPQLKFCRVDKAARIHLMLGNLVDTLSL